MFKNSFIPLLALIACFQMGCKGENKSKSTVESKTEMADSEESLTARKKKAVSLNEKLCSEFPKALVLEYNPDAKRIDIERIELTPGTLSNCKVKLFHGDKEYEFWEGQVAVYPNQMEDPFWQYDPKLNALYEHTKEFGQRGVFIGTTQQLLVLKDGFIYDIVPPNNGATTSTGKQNKEIAFEIAKHYNL